MKSILKKIGFLLTSTLIIIPLLSGLIGGLVGYYLGSSKDISTSERISNFYEDEMSVSVSPATLKKWVDDKDTNYILVDLRSEAEYNTEHFINAINIPAVSMDTDQLVAAFTKLDKNKTIVVHCYSAYCTLGRQVGQSLAKHKIYVKELNVGWSELKYHWDLWNPGAKVTDGANYIVKGDKSTSEEIKIKPCVQGQYGC